MWAMSVTEDGNTAMINPVNSPVKRRLFPPQPQEDQVHDLQEQQFQDLQMAQFTLSQEAKQRWNFDFEKEEPLPGRWVWEKVIKPRLSTKRQGMCDPAEQSNQRKKPTNDFHQISLSDEHREVSEEEEGEEELVGEVNESENNNNLNDSNS